MPALALSAARRSRPKTARRCPARPVASWPGMSARYFYGWNVVAATFVMALFTFGLGFYGLTVYVATLQRLHGWSASTVSAPVTVYYVAGALLTTAIGSVYERFGPRLVVVGASVVLAGGIMALGLVTQPGQLHLVFLVLAARWVSMSGAALNIILAPLFERRRGLAVLAHLVALVAPAVDAGGAARAVGTTTAAALIGRLLTGIVVDRLNRRAVASATLVIQMLGLAVLTWLPSATAVYVGCALFGLGVGNLTTLPGLILAVEWPRERFSALVGLAVGINQFTFAFGPSLVGVIRDRVGGDALALAACATLQALAAVMILLGPGRPPPSRS